MHTTSYQPRVTAGMPLPLLLAKAHRSGGCGLERRHLAALDGLALLLPHHSAEGKATPAQIGDAADYTGRWMRHTLAELEDLGLVQWRRGGVVAGRAAAGWFRVSKERLCALIRERAGDYATLLTRRAEQTRQRIAGLRYVMGSRRHKRRSAPVEVSSYLSPSGEVTGPAEGAGSPNREDHLAPERTRSHAAACRAALQAAVSR